MKEKISFIEAISMDVSKHSALKDYEWAVTLNRECLKLFGIWPDKDETRQRKLFLDLYVIFLLITIICSIIVPSIHSLIRIWDDFMSMVDNLQYTMPILMSTLKFIILWRKKKNLVPILTMIKDDWLKFKTENERNVMINRVHIVRILTMCGYFAISFTFIFGVILPYFGFSPRYLTNVTDPGKLLPVQSYYIYDINESPFYEIAFFLQTFSLIPCVTIYSATDNFLGLLAFHVCGQFENLSSRIQHLDQNDFENSLSYYVRDHRRLIRCIKIIDNTFTLMLFGLLIYFGVSFALYGFFFITLVNRGQRVSFVRILVILLCFLIIFTHTCYYCIIGELLVIHCDRFYKAICECKWYKLAPNKAKSLMILMICAKKPLYITAGGLFPMTMSTYCNLLKTSGGYISFLLAHSE